MGKHRVCSKVICPYYKHEDSQVIYCDGVTGESVTHVAFASSTQAKDYKCRFCQNDFMNCGIKKMLDCIWEGSENETLIR